MTPDEKKNLVTAKLAQRLRSIVRVDTGTLANTGYWDEIARIIMDGTPEEDIGLWKVMAPLLTPIAAHQGVERELRRFEGMPLTPRVIDEVLLELGRVINAASTHEMLKPPLSRSHRSTGLWGGVGDESGRPEAL